MTISADAVAVVGGATGLAGGGATVDQVNTAISAALAALTIPDEIADLDDFSGTPATGDLLQWDGTDWVPYTPEPITVTPPVGFLISGGGAAIAAGEYGDLPPMTYAGTITGVVGLADQSGTVSVQVWKDAITSYPPVVGDLVTTITISGSNRSTVSSVAYTTVSIPFSVGDVIRFSVPSLATSITRVTVGLRIEYEVGP